MRIFAPLCLGLAFLLATTRTQAETNSFVMPLRAGGLPAVKFKLVNHIPQARLARLPKALPVYRYVAKPWEFSMAGLQMLLDQSAFAGTNIVNLLPSGTNPSVTTASIRLITQDRLDYFIVIPSEGRISLRNSIPGPDTTRSESFPDAEEFRKRLFDLAQTFGLSTNEMERQEDGSIFLRSREEKTTRANATSVTARELEVCRAIPESPFNSINDDKIAIELGRNGRVRKFNLTWPTVEAVSTNRLLNISKIVKGIKNGRVLSDLMNEYPKDGIAEIELKDIAIEYYIPGQPLPLTAALKTDIYPIASMLAVFKSKTGETIEAGLYAPILDAK